MKRLSALFLIAALILSLSITAFAAVGDTGFSDVDANAWYAEAVMYCKEHNLMAGTGNNQFAPESNLTRAQLATVLYRIEGTPTVTGTDVFTDTPDGAWYGDAVLWASQQELISGYGGGLFGPNDPVTREQMTTIFWRYAGSPTAGEASNYTDNASIAAYAVSAVNWASANNIVRPVSSGTFAPKSSATRAQVADALMNYDRTKQAAPAPGTAPSNGAKVLVVYFSATNTTKPLAEYIADGLDADLYEIVPETPYTSADLNYGNSSSRTSVEMNDSNARPAISGNVSNMEQYDIVFIGYPIWWGQAPRIVSTFFESYDFSGKTIVPFCTSGSSGIGSSATNLHNLTNGANWLNGQRFSGGTSRSTMIQWVNGLGLDITAE
ncbi:MAG: hypothetical protein HDT18_09300 [Oscillibacter sp.]|nr:hypothetical protein [Oscillibacter sp.]